MKSILLAAAALLAAPAMAQDQTPPATDSSAQIGGLQPSAPALQGTPEPGSKVIFKQAPDPNTAFPPPPAKDSYPVCKKGQFDGCVQAGTGDGHVDRAPAHHAKKHVRRAAVKKTTTTTTTTTTTAPK
ncbi:hypothetical protein [Sphingomonas sp. CL5.1]|uniref:hypothetical protein n=1 Tax=Sphingomonas sp. CL5.1 TaxID=2653203 RepID=UPI0015823684|nr:hypothetical protein [Sphingomonas sp. CL5.1]